VISKEGHSIVSLTRILARLGGAVYKRGKGSYRVQPTLGKMLNTLPCDSAEQCPMDQTDHYSVTTARRHVRRRQMLADNAAGQLRL